jgi:hypothetical protein
MGGGGEETTTQTSGPTNPMVDSTTTKLLTGLQSQFDKGTAVFDKSLDAGVGAPTQTGLQSSWTAATQPGFGRYMGGAIDSFGRTAAGENFGTNDPGYAALRAKAGDDTLRDINALTTASGRFGSGSHIGTATESLGNVYAGMDYQNYQNDIARQERAAQMMPELFGASMLPGQAQVGIGQMYDAGRQAELLGENDLFRRKNDAGWSTLGQATSILAGNAGAGTQQQSTTTPTAPWWQQALGYVVGNASRAAGSM